MKSELEVEGSITFLGRLHYRSKLHRSLRDIFLALESSPGPLIMVPKLV